MTTAIKGIDLKDEKMRFFPLLQGIQSIELSTKKKNGYVKLHLPDEMLEDIMKIMLGQEIDTKYEQYIVSCREKNKSCNGCMGESKKHYNGCFNCYDFSKYQTRD